MELNLVHCENCLDTMGRMPDNSVDSIVTDPPYGLSFMGKKWDYDVPSVAIWKECLRVLKPGGYLLAFAGTRTQHRMCCNIEDAGFEIRDMMAELFDTNDPFADFMKSLNPDQLKTMSKFLSADGMLAWIYGSGFPKSHNIGKSVDKLLGNEREVIGEKQTPDGKPYSARTPNSSGEYNEQCSHNSLSGKTIHNNELTKGTSPYEGWGTALKPALEPITVARKPLSEKTVAANVLKWGTGGINIDGCRVELNGDYKCAANGRPSQTGLDDGYNSEKANNHIEQGRFPANLIHDGSQMVLDLFPHSKSGAMKKAYEYTNSGTSMGKPTGSTKQIHSANEGSAARFFYVAKASKADRSEGLDEPNRHPTVKPTKLMQYLVRLVTPVGGIVYDPFAGSGSTGKACKPEGFNFIGSEMEEDSCRIANQRIK